jgi:hypothetical protein
MTKSLIKFINLTNKAVNNEGKKFFSSNSAKTRLILYPKVPNVLPIVEYAEFWQFHNRKHSHIVGSLLNT